MSTAKRHGALMDLARAFGYIVVTPDELLDMVHKAAATRPERVRAVDRAKVFFDKVLTKLDTMGDAPLVEATKLTFRAYRKDVLDEIELRDKVFTEREDWLDAEAAALLDAGGAT